MDIVWRNGSNGENYVHPMNGLTILADAGCLPTVPDLTWNIVGVGDYKMSTVAVAGSPCGNMGCPQNK